ncbi:hypothetical protein, partial [Bacteroides stercoris]
LEENKPIYIGDKQERRCIVHYDTPSFYFSTKKAQCQEEKCTSLSILTKPVFCVKYLNIQRSQPIHNTFQT